MGRALLLGLVVFLLPSGPAGANCTSRLLVGAKERAKPMQTGPQPGPVMTPGAQSELKVGGDTIETAHLVTTVPFMDGGSTCGFSNDYEEACPYSAMAPDVVYAVIPDADMLIDIDLCASGYDTKLIVYKDHYTPGSPYACNDDYCGADGYRSRLERVQVRTGLTYYVVVDGYGSACGDYQLDITQSPTVAILCPPGAEIEGEPPCYDEYEDEFNGGCCCGSLSFSILDPIPGILHVCGTSGTFQFQGMDGRDTDWYEINAPEATTLSYCGIAEFSLQLVLVDGRNGCDGYEVMDFASSAAFEESCITRDLEPGRYWLWVGTRVFTGVPCGSDYVLTIDGYHPAGTGVVSSEREGEPGGLRLSCSPDPFASRTTVSYLLPTALTVSLAIHAPDGRLVRTLVESPQSSGRQEAVWDGLDTASRPVGSGVYFLRLQAGPLGETRPLVRLR